jgi:hypothetical protein
MSDQARDLAVRCYTYEKLLDRFADYCLAYDYLNGDYVESKWEGEEVWNFILECEGLR